MKKIPFAMSASNSATNPRIVHKSLEEIKDNISKSIDEATSQIPHIQAQ